jgi:hypothetical protein
MGAFAISVMVGVGGLIIVLLLIGRYYPGTGADVIDWKPTRSVEAEAELELDDIDQMLAAQNERRRRRGARERSLEEVELDVARDLRDQHGRRRDYLASREGGREAQQDLEGLLEAANERRLRRGEPPLTAEQLRSELRPGDAHGGPSGSAGA